MAVKLKKTIVLVGMMGAGKTAVGTELARLLSVDFLDSDEEIEKAANMAIAEIFSRDGEPFFRQRETEILARLLNKTPAILSTGGGAFLSAHNRTLISENAVSVWLKVDLELLWSRVKHKNTRPLLQTTDPYKTLQGYLEDREDSYRISDCVVEAKPEYSIAEMAEKVLASLLKKPNVLERL